jgi:hypothetical protein
MSHLTDLELIDAIDGDAEHSLALERRQHLDACEWCRGRADDLRGVMTQAADTTVPEPSPLFWDHFTARVRQGIDGVEPGPPDREGWRASWLPQGSVRWAAFATLVVALMVAGVWQVNAPGRRASSTADENTRRAAGTGDLAERPDGDADPAWAVVRTVADDINWDAAVVGIGAELGAAETVARTLTPEERSELVKLLLAEAKRPGV